MARRQLGTAPSVATDTATKGYVDTNVLTSRLVCTTATGDATANVWAKICTFSTAAQLQSANIVLALSAGNLSIPGSALLSVSVRSNTTGANPFVSTNIIARSGSGTFIADDSFKVISGGFGTDAELWVKKPTGGGQFNFYELSRHVTPQMTVTYSTSPAWETSEPVGAVNNVSSNGVTAAGIPVLTTSGTAAISNKDLTSATNTFPTSLVTLTGSQTMTSKTLTSPRIDSILDTNGATSLVLNARASAVNYMTIFNEVAGSPPGLAMVGPDTNIGFDLAPKGTGVVAIFTGSGITGSTLSATGVGTNKDLNLVTKGTGTVQANGNPVGVKVAVPSTATSTGVEGQWAADSSWLYICTATNTWRRVAIASW